MSLIYAQIIQLHTKWRQWAKHTFSILMPKHKGAKFTLINYHPTCSNRTVKYVLYFQPPMSNQVEENFISSNWNYFTYIISLYESDLQINNFMKLTFKIVFSCLNIMAIRYYVTSLSQPALHNKDDWLTWLLNVHQLCQNIETWKMKCSFVIWGFQLGWLTKVKMWWRIVKLASLKIRLENFKSWLQEWTNQR